MAEHDSGRTRCSRLCWSLGRKKGAQRSVPNNLPFTKEARAYAASLENRVILVDGDQLAELMFEYGLGVAKVNSYQVKRIDNDFFEEESLS